MMQQSFGATGPIDHASFISHNAKQQEPVGAIDTIGAYAVDFRCSLNGNMDTGSNCGVTPVRQSMSSVLHIRAAKYLFIEVHTKSSRPIADMIMHSSILLSSFVTEASCT
jgi:hypothetical protein